MARPTNIERARRRDLAMLDALLERLQAEALDPTTDRRRLASIGKAVASLRNQKLKMLGAAPLLPTETQNRRGRGRPSNGLPRRTYKQRDGNWFAVWYRDNAEHVIEVKDSAHIPVMTRQEIADRTLPALEQRLADLKKLPCGCDKTTGCECERLPCGCKRESAELLGHSCQEAASDTTTPDTAPTAMVDLLN